MTKWLAFLIFLTFAYTRASAEVRYRLAALEPNPTTTNYHTEAYDINDNGMVVGLVLRDSGVPYPSGSVRGAFVHTPEKGFVEIGDYDGMWTQPVRVNNRGQFTARGYGGYDSNGVWRAFE